MFAGVGVSSYQGATSPYTPPSTYNPYVPTIKRLVTSIKIIKYSGSTKNYHIQILDGTCCLYFEWLNKVASKKSHD